MEVKARGLVGEGSFDGEAFQGGGAVEAVDAGGLRGTHSASAGSATGPP
jgi:hypothetical protein